QGPRRRAHLPRRGREGAPRSAGAGARDRRYRGRLRPRRAAERADGGGARHPLPRRDALALVDPPWSLRAMKHVLFVVLPERGHIHPFLGAAEALAARGARVSFYAPRDVRAILTPLGWGEVFAPEG